MIDDYDKSRWNRNVNAMLRAAGDDPEAFAFIDAMIMMLKSGMTNSYDELTRQGFSAADVARAMGVSRQAVWRKYGKSEL